MDNTIMVTSASDYTTVINVPDIPLHRIWKKRGAKYPIDRRTLIQAYYDPSVEYLFRQGILTTDDKDFLREVGLIEIEEEGEVEAVTPLTETYLKRLIKIMPVVELKMELPKLTAFQLEELADYAIAHYTEIQMDRIDLLSKATGRNIMKAIEHFRAAQED